MSVKELAKFIEVITVCCNKNTNCEDCPINCGIVCDLEIIESWLNSEVEE